MAVIAPSLFRSKTDSWRTGNPATRFGEFQESMTDLMAYQYPPPPNGAEMEMSPSGYIPAYPVPPQSGMDIPNSGLQGRLGRRDSFSTSPFNLKRSVSNPTVRPELSQRLKHQDSIPEQPTMGVSGEKKRNKLGYHRTSVACGHCRKRKIRCIPSTTDVQGRCDNCIRLKKDCSFHPVTVDQQPPTETRQKAVSRSSVAPKVGSASSSPAIPSGHPADIHGYPPLAMPGVQGIALPALSKQESMDDYATDTKMPSASTARTYPEYSTTSGTNWMAADASPGSSKPSDLSSNWRSYPHESPLTPAFSPYASHGTVPSATWATSMSTDPSRDDVSWGSYPSQPRSLSFSSESMSSHSQQYPPISQMTSSRAYDRKSSSSVPQDMYPPPTAACTVPGVESISGTTLEPVTGLQSASYSSWSQPYSYSKPNDYGGWYGDPGAGPSGDPQHSPPGTDMYYAQR